MENRNLIPELKRLGIAASHSSALDEDSVRLALEKLGPKTRHAGGESGGDAGAAGHDVKRTHRPAAGHEGGAAHAAPHEEPAKPRRNGFSSRRSGRRDGRAGDGHRDRSCCSCRCSCGPLRLSRPRCAGRIGSCWCGRLLQWS
ncbi:MAG: hypothetical protein U0361_15610 [Nitrospiraceae bacterium]